MAEEQQIESYVRSYFGNNLSHSRTRLLFVARVGHGPGFDECTEYRVGPSRCGKYDVLWCRNDAEWGNEGTCTVAVAWLPRGKLKPPKLYEALLQEAIFDEMFADCLEQPNFSDVASCPQALFSASKVWEIVEKAASATRQMRPAAE